ncbi:3-isopropylmalate dehydratase small subunit [Puniceibacterium sediminis]|uniref:3-isopropylmalate dehydratase n=1 Tax=Puniceibacterium sediminis TaxID=1608407 RepID=A0A238X489_9RHOB|nr:3-isopropylmalate dehydratase small subunit [Puniceibacterium sediminis]SNR53411.1 3-isopropylmalate/(R)-2-methylmalate dehydratase small subunit [Puniceibacterium sediminis]
MKPLDKIQSIAAYLDEDAVDTDIIFPARFLLLMDKKGLGGHAFHERRRVKKGETPFILDRPPFDTAEILVAGKDFGTGSSREQAVWALADLGLRCIIAETFGEIFYANCFKNGVLPIRLDADTLARVRQAAGREEEIVVDLPSQTIVLTGDETISYDVDAYRKEALLLGLDEIAVILRDSGKDIKAFEEGQSRRAPWLRLGPDKWKVFDDLEKEQFIE